MRFLATAMVALASLLMTGALALPGAVVADSANLPSRDLIPLPAHSRFGCNPIEQDEVRRDIVTQSMIDWGMDNEVPRLSIQWTQYLDTTFTVCNDIWRSHPCPENEILEARDILRQRCGLHGAWLIHEKPEGKTYTHDGAPSTVRDNMWGPFGRKVAHNTTMTNKDGVVFNTITFAAEDVEY